MVERVKREIMNLLLGKLIVSKCEGCDVHKHMFCSKNCAGNCPIFKKDLQDFEESMEKMSEKELKNILKFQKNICLLSIVDNTYNSSNIDWKKIKRTK